MASSHDKKITTHEMNIKKLLAAITDIRKLDGDLRSEVAARKQLRI